MIDEFKLCKGCPTKSRFWDPDGYWCCKHPEAGKHMFDPEPDRNTAKDEAPVPWSSMKTCPCGHWVRTKEGGARPKDQVELVMS